MYLVHLHLCRADGAPPTALPAPIGTAVRTAGGVEHVAVHGDARPHPVLGVFVLADCLEDAEACARRAWELALARHASLRDWTLVQAAAPLVPPLLEL